MLPIIHPISHFNTSSASAVLQDTTGVLHNLGALRMSKWDADDLDIGTILNNSESF
ncbi:hypothetical protein K449DRAFT_390137 [Hypoxylon sp. EC38]|nr:hypothetical protein K449DRAFT_390137 [Hypoxylon sp. EC38]